MDFYKYNSIENKYRHKFINRIRNDKSFNDKWVVLEKVHGANFSFITDGESVKVAKRTDFIKDGENFFYWKKIFDKYKDKIIDLYKEIKN